VFITRLHGLEARATAIGPPTLTPIMKTTLLLATLAGVAAIAVAHASDMNPPADASAASAQQAQPLPEPVTPKAIPVPDLPIVSKSEVEGIIIEDMKIGDGYEVKEGGAVVAHYHGTLKEGGKKFDSSFERGEPIGFPLGGVIGGWQKGVPGMKVGGIRRLTIPSKLGYGEQGAGQDIPPNSDLVFVIQLVDAVQTEDVKVGEGEAATGQCVAVAATVVKNAKGEVVEDHPAAKPYIWIPGELQGLSFGLDGMKVGGKRTIKVPKEMNPAVPGLDTKRPSGEALTVELELIAVRNLGGGPRRR
jgi:FKBP-type peptidyl-prolyl cis-trans isomerase